MNDELLSVLTGIRETYAAAVTAEEAGNMTSALIRYALVARKVPALLAIVEAVLKQTGEAKATSWGVIGDGPLTPVAWNLDPEKLRTAVLAELTGKEAT